MDIIAEANEIDVSASPDRYEADDAEHYDALDKTGFFGSQAAGTILMAKSSGRIMLVLRSAAVLEPHTWGNLGGAHKASERPVDAAKREAYEETGYTGEIRMIPLMVYRNGDFRYSNFLGIVEEEFTPHLGWEADDFVWVSVGDWPKPLHFGMKALFSDSESMKAILHYAEMFGNKEVSEDVDLNKAISAAKDQLNDLIDPDKQEPQGQQPASPAAAPAPQTDPQGTSKSTPENQPKKSLAPKGTITPQ